MNSTYQIKNIIEGDEAQLLHGVYIMLVNAARIPPHLGIIIDGNLYSLNVKGPTVDGDLSTMLRTIKQRNIESIFIKLHVPSSITNEQLSDAARKYVLAYPAVEAGRTTCLAPIRDLCSSMFGIPGHSANFIYELLPLLEEKELLASCYHLNLGNYLENGSFFLQRYTMEDIDNQIRMLKMEIGN